jgi:hypothetical protein
VDIRSLRTPVLAYVASRVTVVIAMWLVDRYSAQYTFFDLAKRWDGSWYYSTALNGYPGFVPVVDGEAVQSTLGFFPLFPMAARALAVLPGVGPLAAGVAISLLGGLAATVLVWRLADEIWDRATADRAAVLFAFFPGSLVFSMAYSEGLALALCAGCLLLLHRERWLLAGVLGALATATRPNALALAPAAAVAAFLVIRRERRWIALAAPALVPVGFVAFHVYLRLRTGAWDAYARTQAEGWDQEVSPLAVPHMIGDFLDRPFGDVNVTISLAGALFGLVGFVLLVRAQPPPALLAFTATVVLLSVSTEAMGLKPRFLLTAFPLLYGVAHRLRPAGEGVAAGVNATLLGGLTFVAVGTMLFTP